MVQIPPEVLSLTFSITVSTILSYFIISASAHGWPQKEFFLEVPVEAKEEITTISFLIFHIPVLISCIFYSILLYSVKRSSKVGISEGLNDEIECKNVKVGSNDTSERIGMNLSLSHQTKRHLKTFLNRSSITMT